MAMDYLSIPGMYTSIFTALQLVSQYYQATAVDVERVFSRGRTVLSYQRNRLGVQTVWALLCVEDWIKAGLIKDKDLVKWLRGLPDIEEEHESDVGEGWDCIEI